MRGVVTQRQNEHERQCHRHLEHLAERRHQVDRVGDRENSDGNVDEQRQQTPHAPAVDLVDPHLGNEARTDHDEGEKAETPA